jgi:hypothetical protein
MSCLRQRTLGCNDLLIACDLTLSVEDEWRVHIASIDVVSYRLLLEVHSLSECHTALSIGDDVNVSVPIVVYLVLNHLLDHLFRLEQFVEVYVLSL